MKKVLVIVAHPNIQSSRINQYWIQILQQYPERFTVHQLYKKYPDGQIDVAYEQALVEQHDAVVWQFPVYWFSSPPLLKQWQDEVLTYGWAYGAKGNAWKDKKLCVAVSLGASAEDYSLAGYAQHTVTEVLLPFELTARYIHADYQPHFAFHDLYGKTDVSVEQWLKQSASQYLAHLEQYLFV